MSAPYWLLGDIGGTNIRLALMDGEDLDFARALLVSQDPLPTERAYAWADTPSLEGAIERLVDDLGLSLSQIKGAVIAVAGPVVPGEDRFWFTNVNREFQISGLKALLQTQRVHLINDYHAQGMVIPLVRSMPERLETIFDAPGNPHGALGVLGPGTGLGVAGVYPPNTNVSVQSGATLVIPGEGGNTALGAKVESVRALIPHLAQSLRAFRAVSPDLDKEASPRYEDVLSGPGLSCVYGALCVRDGQEVAWPTPRDIALTASDGSDPRARETFQIFFDALAMACADVAMQYLAVGGVFITGGIAQKNLALLDRERFARTYTQSWRYQDYLSAIPVHVVTSESSGLSGAAAFAAGA